MYLRVKWVGVSMSTEETLEICRKYTVEFKVNHNSHHIRTETPPQRRPTPVASVWLQKHC